MSATLLTASELARELKVSHTAIAKARDRGRLTEIDGRFDLAVAKIQWEQNRQRRRSAPPEKPLEESLNPGAVPADDGSFWRAKTRRETAEASLAELKEAEMRGDLVRAAVVERELASRLVALRESLEALADRLASLVAAEPDPQKCRRMLRDEHRNALSQFSSLLDAHATPAEDPRGSA